MMICFPPTRPSKTGARAGFHRICTSCFRSISPATPSRAASACKGHSYTVNTACATGSQAIGEAFHQVKFGKAPIMIAGAVESDSHPMFIAGFAVMKALATDSNDNPTARQPAVRRLSRAGFVLGEGAGMVVLEEYEHAMARGAKIYAEILGFASIERRFPPDRAPAGRQRARPRRSERARGRRRGAGEVGHIQAHAASTPVGDRGRSECDQAMSLETVRPGSR